MDKFIEELISGDFFETQTGRYILTSDFRKNGEKLCIDINTGHMRWFKPNDHIKSISLYAIDSNNNFHPIKEIKSDANSKIENIH